MVDLGNSARLALVIVDLQNVFLHLGDAYGHAGHVAPAIAALPSRVKPVADAVRQAGGIVISIQFTLVPGRDDEPMIAAHLKELRPFLSEGDFAPGSWGQQLVDELQTAHFSVEKVAYSAFRMTRLEWVLRKSSIEMIMFCGIVTNDSVASTVRDAHVREYHPVVLSDGCAAFSEKAHNAAVTDMATVADIMTCEDALGLLSARS